MTKRELDELFAPYNLIVVRRNVETVIVEGTKEDFERFQSDTKRMRMRAELPLTIATWLRNIALAAFIAQIIQILVFK